MQIQTDSSTRKKNEIVGLIHEFLVHNNMAQTANKLKQEAFIADKEDIQEFICQVNGNQNFTADEKMHKIRTQLEKAYLKQVSGANIEKAYEIMNQVMPQYFNEEEVELFAEKMLTSSDGTDTKLQKHSNKSQTPILSRMFCTYFAKNNLQNSELPGTVQHEYKCQSEVWFVKSVNDYLVLIEESMRISTIDHGCKLIAERQLESENTITNLCCLERSHQEERLKLGWVGKDQVDECRKIFMTSHEKGTVKIWNRQLELLVNISDHDKQVNCMCFYQENPLSRISTRRVLVSAGQSNFFTVHEINFAFDFQRASKDLQQPGQPVKVKLKNCMVRDIKYYQRKNMVLFLCQNKKKECSVKIFNRNVSKWECVINCLENIYTLEVCQISHTFHLTSGTGDILNYSLEKYEKIGMYLGMIPSEYVIRMEKGGPNGEYLASGNENGEILIFYGSRLQPLVRLKTGDEKIVNSVTWINESTLASGSDSGRVMIWGCYDDQQQADRK